VRRPPLVGRLRLLSRRLQILLALAVIAATLGAVASSGASFVSASSFGISATTTALSGDKMSISGGNNQSAVNGTELSAPLQVKIVDANNKPVSDLTVTFAVVTGGGSIVGETTDVTGSDGVARVWWKLGPKPGGNSLSATCAGIAAPQTVTFKATGTAGQPVTIAVNDGNDQSAVAGSTLSKKPSVIVTDAGGNACSGVSVTFAVTSGGGSIVDGVATVTTDGTGVAVVGGWKLGPTVGANTMSATSGILSGSPVQFRATGTLGSPSKMTIVGGNEQTAQVGTAVKDPPSVKVTDDNDNPCSGITVAFAPGAGSGSVSGSPAITNASGIATLGSWILGTDLVADTLTASAAGVTPVTFTASTFAGDPRNFVMVSGNNQSAPVGSTLAKPVVRVTDAYNNGIQGVRVVFAVTGGNGSVAGGSVLTDHDGYASPTSWVLGTTADANTLTATCATPSSALTFTATGKALAASGYVVSSSSYGPPAGSPVTITAQLADTYGNPVATSGLLVTFTKTGSGGSLPTPATATTLANGAATIVFTTGTVQNTQYAITATSGTSPNQLTGKSPTITTVAAVPYRMALSAGNNQSATVNTSVATAPSVIVYDLYNNVVPNATVTFAVTGGSGSIATTSALTNAAGVATCGSWTLGIKAGANTLTASVGTINGSPVTFTATGLAGPATKYVVTPSNLSPVVGTGVTITAQLADQYGNPVATSGIRVTFSKTGTGGRFSSTRVTTNSSGIATTTFTTSTTSGRTYTFKASSTSGGTRTGTSAAVVTVPGTPTQIAAYAGNAQTATVGTAVATAPSVRVRDSHNNAVPGVVVTFAVTSGGGSITTAAATTNASGIATCGAWTQGTTAGANTLTATRAGLTGSPVTFTATGVAGAATKYLVTSSDYNPIAGTTVTITARLADQYNNTVAAYGVAVTFAKTGTGGSFSGANPATTNTSGVATIAFITGTPAGLGYTVSATSTGGVTGTSPPITTH
jgi:hypothetical protein